MQHVDRKAAIAAYKERKVAAGIYVVRCAASGQQWAGSAVNLATIWNRLCFTLRQGTDRRPLLQTAWQEHGPESFTFSIVEQLEDEEPGYTRDRALQERLVHWCKVLDAQPM